MVDEALIEDRKRIEQELEEDPYEDIYMITMSEIEIFNYFLKSLNVSIDTNPNVIGAVSGTVRFLLMQPIARYNASMKLLDLKKVRYSTDLIECLKFHLPVFYEFDNQKIPQSAWVIYSMNRKFVQVLLKISPESQEIVNRMNAASVHARENGWVGELQVITRSPEKLIFPV